MTKDTLSVVLYSTEDVHITTLDLPWDIVSGTAIILYRGTYYTFVRSDGSSTVLFREATILKVDDKG